MARIRARSAVVLGVGVAMLLAACSGQADDPDTDAPPAGGDDEAVTLTWWHNGNNEPMLSFWQGVADDFKIGRAHV